MPILGLYTFNLQYPESMTKMIPSTVSDVSAMFVATTHFLIPSGDLWKILACRSDGSCEYIGRMDSSGAFSISVKRSVNT